MVISDMRMPGMDGATLLGHIRDRYPSHRATLSSLDIPRIRWPRAPFPWRTAFWPNHAADAELQATIERVCTLQDLLCTPEIRAHRWKRSVNCPPFQIPTDALTRAVHDPTASIGEMWQTSSSKTSPCRRKSCRLVNSAFFGLAQRVTTLQSAVSFLGMDTIQNLALASEAFRIFVPDSRIPQNCLRGHAAERSTRSPYRPHASAGQNSLRRHCHGSTAP